MNDQSGLLINENWEINLFSALRRPDGTFVLNGAWGMARPGDYDGFQYRRQDPEMISSSGPLRYPVDIMVTV